MLYTTEALVKSITADRLREAERDRLADRAREPRGSQADQTDGREQTRGWRLVPWPRRAVTADGRCDAA